ncbi:NAD(P)-dependent oxidoreductase [Ureibacillus chungkukjangi]|uniref:NADPH-dependent glutamate synthase beta subunit-like oxidoreductase n=1 Tax=Ureibacillus chungkukjangi TaxID=1202712 RepID=A0A318TCL1_9BACL|nr:NAD(P)-dependent oxidoreductase [Ureibacillus chungkukjangi]MCM3390364.1 NAD(P)-dependent oxidoreductase [Ureibacillus chungkukjangi]PYF02454.1 NADPH-dependent glutamate synthase beta subunit-like oxidoreductase [Ureibacillus chungkukjangi]
MSTITGGRISSNLVENFEEIHKGLTRSEAIEEANRCLYCYDAPCITACPTSIQIPKFIKKIATDNLKGSAKTILEANPVGASCARVCPTEELCEGACVLNHDTKPISIGHLQRYATDWAMKQKEPLFKAGDSNGKSVAIIGSGPAGLSAARELSLLGYQVTIFESAEEAGGLDRYGIVSFRLPREVVQWEVDQVEQLGVEIKTNTTVGVDISTEEIINQFERVILAVGMGQVPNLGIEGEGLKGVYDAIEFVKKTKVDAPTDELIGKKVAVIGAGNTAIDAATTAIRLGASNVKIVYRRTKNEMSAYQFEYDFAKQDGVEFRWLTAPSKIVSNEQNEVAGLECVKMTLDEPGLDGRQKPVPLENSETVLDVNVVIKAIGQSKHTKLIEAFGLNHTKGVVDVDSETFQTSQENIFACGDCIFGNGQGEAMVVSAAQQGKEVAKAIHRTFMLQSEIA